MKPERGGGFSFLVHDFYFLFPSTSAYPYLRSYLLLGKQRRFLIDTVPACHPRANTTYLPPSLLTKPPPPPPPPTPAHSFHQKHHTSLQTRTHAARTSTNRPHSPHPIPSHLQTTRKQNYIQKIITETLPSPQHPPHPPFPATQPNPSPHPTQPLPLPNHQSRILSLKTWLPGKIFFYYYLYTYIY